MAPRTVTTPRKNPQQQRSRETVDAIMKATARILTREGYDRCSTNRVALAAGVSIGSLYQYFPSKEALVAALVERHNAEMNEVVLGQMRAVIDAPLPDAVHGLVRGLLRAHAVDPRLHKVLIEQVPRVGRLQHLCDADEQIEGLARGYLLERAGRVLPEDVDLAVFLLTRAVRAMCFAAVCERPEMLENESLADEIAAMVLRYLTGSAERGGRARR